MPPPPQRFRLVYRDFSRFEFDQDKNEIVYQVRAFDLGHVTMMFPGYVAEREDTRVAGERRIQAIGDVLGECYVMICILRQGVCRIITAWEVDRFERDILDELRGF